MSDATRRRQDPMNLRPGTATLGGEAKRPPAPGAVSSPQIPGKVPDRSAVPGHGQLPVPKPRQVIRPLTEYGTAQEIMDVYELAPGEEDTKARWEQEPASYEEERKGNPALLTPVRPAPRFTPLVEGLAGIAALPEEETVALPAEAVSAAGAPAVPSTEPLATPTGPATAAPANPPAPGKGQRPSGG